ncbi:hypothetical protein SteCoe_11592 [Stentor coeruleus]|uniref:TOG domain-containing protein n=1 Tax=Stentor coeruleus TaxID=5963 RepID=A0A1R2CCT8_9CILI|nr:hypothetical protein SteCoe_11592 [Stentor coeruleus]
MGCCQNRSELFIAETKSLRKPSFDYQTEDSSYEFRSITDTTLVDYLKMCREKRNWEVICTLISNQQSVFDIKPVPSWTFRPRTIGSVALQYLSRACKRYPQETIPFLAEILPDLVKVIQEGKQDKVEQVMILFSYLTISEERSIRKNLVELKFFNLVLPMFLDEKFEFRQVCVITCARIYKNCTERQRKFIDDDGITNLMQVISMGPLRGRFFSKLIQCIIDLILDENKEPNSEHIGFVISYIDLNVVNSVDIAMMSDAVRDKFFNLISLLQTYKANKVTD